MPVSTVPALDFGRHAPAVVSPLDEPQTPVEESPATPNTAPTELNVETAVDLPTPWQKTFVFVRKNALCLLFFIFFNEFFLLLGARLLRLSNPDYNIFLSRAAAIHIGWLSGAANFLLNSICRAAFYTCQHDERGIKKVSPGETACSGQEAVFYTLLHSAGFPLFGVGAARLTKFNAPLRAAKTIAVGMGCLMAIVVCICSGMYAAWLAYGRLTKREENTNTNLPGAP